MGMITILYNYIQNSKFDCFQKLKFDFKNSKFKFQTQNIPVERAPKLILIKPKPELKLNGSHNQPNDDINKDHWRLRREFFSVF